MRISIASPQYGALTDPSTLVDAARLAEDLGFDGLWVAERLLSPLEPREPYPASEDGALPVSLRRMLDPLATLAFLAAHTTRLRLGTSVLATPLHRPLLLARQLTSIDVLSGGRLAVGLGAGWSTDERVAVGEPGDHRSARNDEFLDVLRAAWTDDVVAYAGRFERVPASWIDLKPVQKPHPPLYLAAFTPASMARVARCADGWNPGAMPFPVVSAMFDRIRQMATDVGRDPGRIELVLRGNVTLTTAPLGPGRRPFTGAFDQLIDDVHRCEDIGVDEVILDAGCSSAGETPAAYLAFASAVAERLVAPPTVELVGVVRR